MDSLVYRFAWDAPRDHKVEFALYSHATAERMPPGRVRQQAHVDDWLLIVFHDAAQAQVGRKTIVVGAGEAMLWVPGQVREYGREDVPWVHTWVQFSGRRVKGLLAAVGLNSGKPWLAGQPETVERGVSRLHAEMMAHERRESRILGNLFENWLLEMRRSAREVATGAGREVNGRMQALKTRLDIEHGRSLSLQEMGRMAGMSPSHLSAVFRARYGVAPVRYHIARRMDAARYLLANRTMMVGEIAAAVGWPDPAAFSRMFKRVVGVGPREYRSRSSRSLSSSIGW
jgi:AraC-like DNA-binding protein